MHTKFWLEILMAGHHLGDLGIGMRITVK